MPGISKNKKKMKSILLNVRVTHGARKLHFISSSSEQVENREVAVQAETQVESSTSEQQRDHLTHARKIRKSNIAKNHAQKKADKSHMKFVRSKKGEF